MIPDHIPVDLWKRAHRVRMRVGSMNRKIAHIVIHASSGHGSAQGLADMWERFPAHGEPATSAHFAIGRDGFVVQAVHLDDIAKHAHSANADSVGIEFCCRRAGTLGPDDPGEPPTPEQLQKGAQLIAWLCRARGIPADRTRILGHAEADPDTTHTECPEGDGIDVDHLVSLALEIS